MRPSAGRISIDGADVTGATPQARSRAGLARTFQITSIVPSLDVLGNVALAAQSRAQRPLRLFDVAARDETLNAAARAAAIVGLGPRAGVLAGRLSHGEKRALELAMALAAQPKPSCSTSPWPGWGGRNPRGSSISWPSLKGRYAILLVEHDMDAVFALADRVTVLVYGRRSRRHAGGGPRATRPCAPLISATRRPDAGGRAASFPAMATRRRCSGCRSRSAQARW